MVQSTMSNNNGLISTAAFAQFVQQQQAIITPQNTKAAYGPKEMEFKQFCDYLYQSEGEYRYIVNHDKLYRFLMYVAFRGRKKRGGGVTESLPHFPGSNGGAANKFDRADFERVRSSIQDLLGGDVELDGAQIQASLEDRYLTSFSSEKGGLLGFNTINQYKCAVQRLYNQQRDANANNLPWDRIFNTRVKALLKLVKDRMPAVRKRNYEEKIDHHLLPYQITESMGKIEERLWLRHNGSCLKLGMAALRDRFTLLFTNQGILRGESVFKAELSDLVDVGYCPREDPTPYHILILMMHTGKVNKGHTLFGRAMRHLKASKCVMGALGLYLLARFEVTKEKLDFSSNSKWFDVKLLVDSATTNATNCTAVSDKYYANVIKTVCRDLGIETKHFIHIGRCAGPVQLEMNEVPSDLIKVLGNWNLDVMDSRYSAMIPIKAMRVLAGHQKAEGVHFNPRTQFEVPGELRSMVFPWIEGAKASVIESRGNSSSGAQFVTAASFLRLLDNLRNVIVQDVAALMIEGRTHTVFNMPVFSTPAFNYFKSEMKTFLERQDTQEPRSILIQRALPGVNTALMSMKAEQKVQFDLLNTSLQRIEHQLVTRSTMVSMLQRCANILQQGGSSTHHKEAADMNSPSPTPVNTHEGQKDEQQIDNSELTVIPWRPNVEYASLARIYILWFGKSPCNSEASRQPLEELLVTGLPRGGVNELESLRGSSWRASWESSQRKRLSRMKKCAKFVEFALANSPQTALQQTMEVLEYNFQLKNSRLASFDTYIGKEGDWEFSLRKILAKQPKHCDSNHGDDITTTR